MAHRTYSHSVGTKATWRLRLGILILLCICVLLGLVSLYRYFRVVTITCIEDEVECSQEHKELLSMYTGRFLFDEFSPKILGKKVTVDTKLPQTLIVHLENQDVLAHVYLDREKQQASILYTDSTLQRVDPTHLSSTSATLAITDLTRTLVPESTVLSQDMFDVYTNLLEFSKTEKVEEIVIQSKDEIEIRTQRSLTAIVSAHSLKQQLHSLQLLLVSPTIEQKPARVDLRFDRPVLQYY